MKYSSNPTVDTSSCVTLLARLYGHIDMVWAVRWRPNSYQIASCGGLCILLWHQEHYDTRDCALSDNPSVPHNPWQLKAIIYNETKQPKLFSSLFNRDGFSNSFSWDIQKKNTFLDVYSMNLDSVNSGVHSRTIRNLAWSPHGDSLAAASFDSTVSIWKECSSCVKDTTASDLSHIQNTPWKCISHIEGHQHEVKSVSWNSSGKQLVTCSRDKTIWIHSLVEPVCKTVDDESNSTLEFSCAAILTGHTQGFLYHSTIFPDSLDVKHVVWHPREDIIISSSYDNSIRLWCKRATNGSRNSIFVNSSMAENEFLDEPEWECFETLNDHTSTVWEISLSPNGCSFASCSEDKSFRIWTCHTSSRLPVEVPCEETSAVSAQSISPLSTTLDQKHPPPLTPYWFLVQPGFKPLRASKPPPKSLDALDLQPDKCNGNAEKFIPSENNVQKNDDCISFSTGPISSLKWSCTATIVNDHKGSIYSVAWHPVLNVIATACGDNAVRLYRLKNNTEMPYAEFSTGWFLEIEIKNAHEADVNSVAWKSGPEEDGSWLFATCSDDKSVHVYSYKTESQ